MRIITGALFALCLALCLTVIPAQAEFRKPIEFSDGIYACKLASNKGDIALFRYPAKDRGKTYIDFTYTPDGGFAQLWRAVKTSRPSDEPLVDFMHEFSLQRKVGDALFKGSCESIQYAAAGYCGPVQRFATGYTISCVTRRPGEHKSTRHFIELVRRS